MMLSAMAAAQVSAGELKHVTLLVDCSRHMTGPLQEGSRTTRYEAATKAALAMLAKLAEQRDQAVTVTLFGESVLATHNSQPLTKQDLADFRDTLQSTSPGGNAAVLAALQDAAQATSGDPDETTKIIVLTSGHSDVRAIAGAKAKVLDALKEAHAETHFVQVGTANELNADLQDIADATQGTVIFTDTSANLLKGLTMAAGFEQKPTLSEKVKTVSAQAPEPLPVVPTPPAEEVEPSPVVVDANARRVPTVPAVLIDITCYGQAVADAKVYLRGDRFDLVYDRVKERESRQLRLQRLSGTYVFTDVPAGEYTLEIAANVKNRKYVVFRNVAVENVVERVKGQEVVTLRSIKVQLEKVKDPLFQAAAPPPAPAP
jgi:hypothetical protein